MSLSNSDIKVIKIAFEEYAAAHVAVVAAMKIDDLPESLTRAEERAADHLLTLMRRMLPMLVNTCERALAVDMALLDARNGSKVIDVRVTIPDFIPDTPAVRTFIENACRRSWDNGVDKVISVIQSKLHP